MAIHDWTLVRAGIFHDFHQEWIREIKRALNTGVLPPGYYALSEQHAVGFGADVLTLQTSEDRQSARGPSHPSRGNGGGLLLAPPPVALTAEAELEYFRRKQSSVVVRTAEDDQIVAVVEVVSPDNKSSQHAIDAFVRKTVEFFDRDIHLLVLDLHPPSARDPDGIHGAIWNEIGELPYEHPTDRLLTLAAYECSLTIRAYVQGAQVGESLPDMPLYLQPGGHVLVPLEKTYLAAFAAVPQRWRSVLQ